MNKKHKRTLEAIFATPVRANIVWKDVESLFITLGAKIDEGRGSRVRILLNNEEAVFQETSSAKGNR